MWTCEHKLAMGRQTDSQVDTSSMQVARKPFQCSLACMPVQRKTILKPTCVNLRWVAKRWKTCTHLHANLSSIKVNTSHHKPSPVHTSHGKMESQVIASWILRLHLKRKLTFQTISLQCLLIFFLCDDNNYYYPLIICPPPPHYLAQQKSGKVGHYWTFKVQIVLRNKFL